MATVCYAYLSDNAIDSEFGLYGVVPPSFARSRWFTRGWTLQELIAPKEVIFYTRRWKRIGTKKDLCTLLHEITSIYEEILQGGDVESASVAERMAWAGTRTTTRVEDMAYSLLGIFDVNMPLLYGEGRKAFTRLQEEILRTSNDQSLFAWSVGSPLAAYNYLEEIGQKTLAAQFDFLRGLLAESPADFTKIRGIEAVQNWPGHKAFNPPRIHNKCVYIDLPVLSSRDIGYEDEFSIAVLGCYLREERTKLMAICLREWYSGAFLGRKNDLVLIPDTLDKVSSSERIRKLIQSLQVKEEIPRTPVKAGTCFLRRMPSKSSGYDYPRVYCRSGAKYDAQAGCIMPPAVGIVAPQVVLYFDSHHQFSTPFAVALYHTLGQPGFAVKAFAKALPSTELTSPLTKDFLFAFFDSLNTQPAIFVKLALKEATQVGVWVQPSIQPDGNSPQPFIYTISVNVIEKDKRLKADKPSPSLLTELLSGW
jgi:hypothetical protein